MSTKNTNELVEEVRNADKEIARELINSGVRDAQSRWIEAHLITEALALERNDIVRTTRDDRKVADLLRALASSIDKTSAFH